MLPTLPLRDEDNLDETGSDSDGGVYGTQRILACRHGRVLLHCSALLAMLVRDPIWDMDTFICEPSWRGFQTQFNGTIIYCSKHGGSFSHNCHKSNFLVVWITTNTKKVEVKRYSSGTRRWDLMAAMPLISMACVRASSPATLISDVFYWVTTSKYIIAYDNTTKALYYVKCPEETHDDIFNCRLHTMKGRNGGVGLAVLRGFIL